MIPFLLVLAVVYWLAAPDPVTAGARTATGTAAKAAGTGARAHWVSGRKGRELTRTERRERWGGHKKGVTPKTWQRRALKAEHGAVIAAKAVKGTAGLTAAAVRPVPGAVKAGWNKGQDRHRVKAGNRPVPIVVDPPWWRREQPRVQPGEQAPEQVQAQPGNSPEVQAGEQVQAEGPGTEGDPDKWRVIVNKGRRGYEGHVLILDQQPHLPEQYVSKVTGRTPEKARAAAEWLIGEEQRDHGKGLPADIEWIDQAGDADQAPLKTVTDPTDTTTGQPAAPTPTEGDPVTYTGIDELDNLTSVKDMAKLVADMAEESDFAQLVDFCKNASDETRDFGSDMAGDVAEFEEIAAKIGDLLAELADAAQKVDTRADELIGG